MIVNPIAGGRKQPDSLLRRLQGHFFDNGQCGDIQVTGKAGDATRFATEAIHHGNRLVVAVGGDGTVNEVASALVNSGVTLGIIPLGSGNGLARSLNIPVSFDEACRLIKNGHVSEIDVGRVNERYFFLVLGVGFDAAVGRSFNDYHRRGPLPYFYLGMREYLRYRPQQIKLEFGDSSLDLTPFLVVIANGLQYGNNATIAPRAKLNDGLLDVCIVHSLTPPQLFSAVPKLFRGRLDKYSQAEYYQADRVILTRLKPDYVNLDGEAFSEDAVIEVSMLPNALRVVTPPLSNGLIP